MYAVIETAGKQYRVELGTQLEVDRIDVEPGQTVQLDRVLLIADGETSEIGRPTVADAVVAADVVRQDRGEKIVVFKYGPKTRRRVKQGHRQDLTILRISDISWGDRSAAADAKKRATEDKKAADAAAREAAAKAEADRAVAAKLAKDAEPAKSTGTGTKAGVATTKTDAKPATKAAAKASTTKASTTKATTKTAGAKAAGAKATEKPARKPASRTQAPAPDEKPKRRPTKKDE
jgi:large subunit ribosomal protein L21